MSSTTKNVVDDVVLSYQKKTKTKYVLDYNLSINNTNMQNIKILYSANKIISSTDKAIPRQKSPRVPMDQRPHENLPAAIQGINWKEAEISTKIQAILDILKENISGESVIIFSAW